MPITRQPHKTRQASPPVTPQDQRRLDSRAEDSRLIAEALAGSDLAYKRLMEKYHDAIAAFIGRMVHDREQIEDLTQEAFIKAFSSLKSFNEEFAFSTWLYKIASNNSIDHIRRKKLQMLSIDKPVESRDSDYVFELPDDTVDVDRDLIDSQRASMIKRAIDDLPEKYRRVIQMRHVDELSYEEIAAALKLPIGTVKAHIFRARELLYKQLRHKIRQY
jgi:RNA polymerase sigma-70 factor (ECF subfamily)